MFDLPSDTHFQPVYQNSKISFKISYETIFRCLKMLSTKKPHQTKTRKAKVLPTKSAGNCRDFEAKKQSPVKMGTERVRNPDPVKCRCPRILKKLTSQSRCSSTITSTRPGALFSLCKLIFVTLSF
jgi:hypothetical protein